MAHKTTRTDTLQLFQHRFLHHLVHITKTVDWQRLTAWELQVRKIFVEDETGTNSQQS